MYANGLTILEAVAVSLCGSDWVTSDLFEARLGTFPTLPHKETATASIFDEFLTSLSDAAAALSASSDL